MSSALGGTGAAGMPGAEAAFLNPALIPLYNGSAVEAYYRDGYADYGQHRQSMGLGAIDNSRDVFFPGTIHYLRTRDTGLTNRPAEGDLWHLGLGEQIGQFAFGVAGYRLVQDVKDDRRYTQWNYTLGALYMWEEGFGVAYVLKNLAGPGSEVPLGLRQDMEQVVGVFARFGEVARIRVDIARQERFNPDHKLKYMIGLETKNTDYLLLRFGYRYDDLADQRVWTAGLGFEGPRLKLDYAVEKSQERAPGALHSVDLRLTF